MAKKAKANLAKFAFAFWQKKRLKSEFKMLKKKKNTAKDRQQSFFYYYKEEEPFNNIKILQSRRENHKTKVYIMN